MARANPAGGGKEGYRGGHVMARGHIGQPLSTKLPSWTVGITQTTLLKASSGATEDSPYKSPGPLKGGVWVFLKLRPKAWLVSLK